MSRALGYGAIAASGRLWLHGTRLYEIVERCGYVFRPSAATGCADVIWASIPSAFVVLVAMVSVHLQYGFSSVKLLGYELDLLYLGSLLSFVLQGWVIFHRSNAMVEVEVAEGEACLASHHFRRASAWASILRTVDTYEEPCIEQRG